MWEKVKVWATHRDMIHHIIEAVWGFFFPHHRMYYLSFKLNFLIYLFSFKCSSRQHAYFKDRLSVKSAMNPNSST